MGKETPEDFILGHKVVMDDTGLSYGVYPHSTEGIRVANAQVRDLKRNGVVIVGAPLLLRQLKIGWIRII